VNRRDWAVLGTLSGLALAVGGGALLLERRPIVNPFSQSPGAGGLTVSFPQGPSGSTQGGHLPLTVAFANQGVSDVSVSVTGVVAVPVSGTSYTGGRWFFLATAEGQTAGVTVSADKTQASFVVPAGGSVSVLLATDWSGNPGTYRIVVYAEVSGVAQTFPDSQTFTVTTQLTPAQLSVQLSGGPSGNYTGAKDSTTTHIGGPITAVVTNTGQQPYVGTLSMIVAPAGSLAQADGLQFFDLSTGAATRQVNIPGGGSDTSQWVTNWTFEPTSDGTYHAVLVANP
jgi:hypothetical protein